MAIKKLLEILLTGCLAGCSGYYYTRNTEPAREESTYDVYKENIDIVEWNKFDISDLPRRKIPLPSDLEGLIFNGVFRPVIKNPERFEMYILDEVEKLGLDIKNADPKQLVCNASDIVKSKMDYAEVDKDEWKNQYGWNLSHDEYFELRMGDCDIFSCVTQSVFEVLKRHNKDPRCQNVYLGLNSTFPLSKDINGHAWNFSVGVYPKKLIISDFDVTAYENRVEFGQVPIKAHLFPRSLRTNRARFFQRLGDKKNCFGSL